MIEQWLARYKKFRTEKDIDGLLNLFADKFEFHEDGSFEGYIWDKDALRLYFEPILKNERELSMDFEVFSAHGDNYSVICNSRYTWDGEAYDLSEIYLIRLNKHGAAKYFYQVGNAREYRV